MHKARRATIWEAGAIAAATALAATLAPAPSLALLAPLGIALIMSAFVAELRPRAVDAVALAAIALIWILAGQTPALLFAMAWRLCAETRGWARVRDFGVDPAIAAFLHRWAGPVAALGWRMSGASAVGLLLMAFAALCWLDWLIRRLAAWRLGEADQGGATDAVARHAIIVGLVALPSSDEAALAALIAMALARKARLPVRSMLALQTRL
jgi:hypothetical protein